MNTIKMGIHWEGMSDYYRGMILGTLRREGVLMKGADYDAFLDSALDVMFHARQIRAGKAVCDCGCEGEL